MKKLWKRNMVAGAVLLLVCGAIFLNGRYAQQVEETDKILGQATLVDGTEGDAEEVSGEALPGDYFATARLTRQQARDSVQAYSASSIWQQWLDLMEQVRH